MAVDTYDVVVIGAGLTGSSAALALARAGVRVLVIDAGPILDESTFARRPPTRSLFHPAHQLFRLKLLLKGDRSAAFNKFFDQQTQALYVDRRTQPYATPPGRDFDWWRVRAVGGRGHLWGRVMLRVSSHQTTRPGLEWPIDVTDLAAQYSSIEQLLELGGAPGDFANVPDGQYVHERQLNHIEAQFANVVEREFGARRVLVNRVAQYDPGPLNPLLRAALETGRVELRPSTIARRLVANDAGEVRSLEVVDRHSGESSIIDAQSFVLAASAFESVRLLLNSGHSTSPNGLGNNSGLLGTRLLEHVMHSVMFRLPKSLRDRTPSFQPYPFKLNEAPHGFYMPSFAHLEQMPLTMGFGIQGVFSSDSGLGYIGAFGEMVPSDANRLSLDAETDQWGVPRARIDFSWSDDEVSMHQAQVRVVEELLESLEKAIGQRIERPATAAIYNLHASALPTPGSNHECGGARMGADPSSGVCDASGSLFEAPNVVLADSSVFPSLPEQNPTLTAMALGYRACTLLAERLRNRVH